MTMVADTSTLMPLVLELPIPVRNAILPSGFVAGGTTCGIKASGRPDLAVILVTGAAAATAAVFTPNRLPAAPVRLSRRHLEATEPAGRGGYGWTRAVISTSGCANAATGPAGDADQADVAGLLATALSLRSEEVLTMSTGVIGTRLPLDRVATGIVELVGRMGTGGSHLLDAAEALRTTDSAVKVSTVTIDLPAADGGGVREVRISGIAKGVGMIHPQMATMLSVLLTDAVIDPRTLHGILRVAAAQTWNQLSVDGDTSTNDTVFALASGAAGIAAVTPGSPAAATFAAAVHAVARDLARQQAADGEGATTLITCQVSSAVDDADARAIARSVISSSLVKAAVHGRDPNWGRIAAAAGNARLPGAAILEAAGLDSAAAATREGDAAAVDADLLRIAIAGHAVFDGRTGGPLDFDRPAARRDMDGPELLVRLDLGLGTGRGEAFGCDLSEAYVRENSEYTT
ncbi:MAG: bifunctional ornithine acetyltransferase/N-acetylglutamate synthase [Chloroflexota bacterium]